MQQGPLSGIRVVGMTQWQAGPSCTLLIAFLGAEVIKVESFTHLDPFRQSFFPTQEPDQEDRPYDRTTSFHTNNAGKLSVQLNLKHPKGIALMKELLATADGFVYNMRQVAIDKLGLDYESLKAINPGLVVLSMTNSGSTGPERDYYGYAPTFVGLGGVSYISGYPDHAPCEHTGWPDTEVGAWAAFSLLAGLHQRERTGKGTYVDYSGREAMAWTAGEALMDYTLNSRVRGRVGNRDDFMAPHNVYRCQGEESWITIAVASDAEWEALCDVMGRPAWTSDERFATTLNRWKNQDEMDKLLEEWTSQHDNVGLMERLQEAGVAAVPSYSNEELYSGPHLRERDFFKVVEHPLGGAHPMSRPPWGLSETPADIDRPAPLMGEHNEYVLHDVLGHSLDEIAGLKDEQAVH